MSTLKQNVGYYEMSYNLCWGYHESIFQGIAEILVSKSGPEEITKMLKYSKSYIKLFKLWLHKTVWKQPNIQSLKISPSVKGVT